ncbi:cellulase family glycosylhydrolase [Stenotrophobium rhamnosiphilum]|uniref:Beta-1,4-xylanase n=1 Tax=Stenotrophobium rhamnosiphilum TaxID=2029166 RepID=A0A2T5MBY7_9GAMM|nr:cellulase family glycosylhydrolase [Stenotrophobium rhamnosiphilum]PTU30089.1 beta-1,4-xylanase [Stenotrophobium rhamnosiphilum]
MFSKAQKVAAALFLLAPLIAQAATLPAPALANSPGQSIHFVKGNTKDLDLMAAAGVKVVRADFKWDAIESQKGVYNWAPYDELVNNLTARGMRPYFILDYSNALYEEVRILTQNGVPYAAYIDAPNSPSSVAGFSAWAKAAALRYKSKNVIWEIWNEPNMAAFWKPTPNVVDYTTLTTATCNAIHSVAPNAVVVGGAIAGLDWNYLYAYLGAGVLDCIDAVSVHAYRWDVPETVDAEFQYLQWVIGQLTPASRSTPIPLISGEWGYPTFTNAYPLDLQAAYAVRMQLNNLLNNVPISIWYDWKNNGTDASNKEHNFGIVTATLGLKPAYYALKTLSQQLGSYKLVNRVATANSQDYILIFANAAGKKKAVAWTTGANYTTSILPDMTSNNVRATVVSMLGTSSVAQIGAAGLPITLSFTPQYIDLSLLP